MILQMIPLDDTPDNTPDDTPDDTTRWYPQMILQMIHQMILRWYPLNPDDTPLIQMIPLPPDDTIRWYPINQLILPWSRWYSDDTFSIQMIPPDPDDTPPSRWYWDDTLPSRWYSDDTISIQMIPRWSRWCSDDTLSIQMILRWYPLNPDDTQTISSQSRWFSSDPDDTPPPHPDDTQLIPSQSRWYPLIHMLFWCICCNDERHMPDRKDSPFLLGMLAKLVMVNKTMKDFLFKEGHGHGPLGRVAQPGPNEHGNPVHVSQAHFKHLVESAELTLDKISNKKRTASLPQVDTKRGQEEGRGGQHHLKQRQRRWRLQF
jgi:hypothetical protein